MLHQFPENQPTAASARTSLEWLRETLSNIGKARWLIAFVCRPKAVEQMRNNVPSNVTHGSESHQKVFAECVNPIKRTSPLAQFCSAVCQRRNYQKRTYQPASLLGKRCRCGKIHYRRQSDFCSQRCKDKFCPAASRKNKAKHWRDYYARNRKQEIARALAGKNLRRSLKAQNQ